MIVECPNCFLEQPLDQYCASCGKELEHLLSEQKAKKTARIQKANFSIGLLIVLFLTGSYFYFTQISTEPFASNNLNAAQETTKQVLLPKARIAVPNKSQFKEKSKENKCKSNRPKVSKETDVAVAASPELFLKEDSVEAKPPISDKIEETSEKIKKLQTFMFVSLENCDSTPETNELSLEEFKSIKNCAQIYFTTSKQKTEAILEDGVSFATQVAVEIKPYLIELHFILTTDMFVEEFTQTLPLNIGMESAATLWGNTGHSIESTEPLDEELLSNYATSALFNLSTASPPPPKLYFLASYN